MNGRDPKRCERCGGLFRSNDERAEVAEGERHLIIHASCMHEGEEVA